MGKKRNYLHCMISTHWARQTDPELNYLEALFLKKVLCIKLSESISISDEDTLEEKAGFLGLVKKGILKPKKECELTEYGEKLNRDITYRNKEIPKLNIIGERISQICAEKEIASDTLSKLSGVNSYKVRKLEGKIKSKAPFYIEDLISIIEVLELKFDNVIEITKDNNDYYDTESPIEDALIKELTKLNNLHSFTLETQKEFIVKNQLYRGDIFITFEGCKGINGLIVECDGHEFHERTKEQAARDKKRDRELLSIGIVTMRFTGSEIYSDAKECAKEVVNTYEKFLISVQNKIPFLL